MVKSGVSLCDEYHKKSDRDYNKTRPSPSVAYGRGEGYNREWKKYRAWYLKQHPFCVECKKEGILKLANVVDHIIAVRKGGGFWDTNNHQSLCTAHHNSKTVKEDGGFGK